MTDGMHKSKLQELCQRKSWPLPEYTTVSEGPVHAPHFKATVLVNGLTFQTENVFKRAKDAQIDAAKLALAHLTPEIETVVVGSVNGNKRPLTDVIGSKVMEEEQSQASENSDAKRNKHSGGELHVYKNQLQSFVIKKGYDLPIYTSERKGPPHNSRFKSKVTVNGMVYESPDFFSTLKESEHAAAKVALLSLSPPESQDVILDKSVFKNLLQELTQKSGLIIPIYNTTSSGAGHTPIFVSNVVVGGETFCGQEAKTKKLAEMNAAEVAYNCLSKRENQGRSGSAPVYVTKGVSASDSGAANQLGAPSKFISTQSDIGLPISGDQESPKQIPSSCAEISSNNLGSTNAGIASTVSPPHANPSEPLEYIPLAQDKCPSPEISPEESHDSVSVSIPDIFYEPNSSLHNVVRVYPRAMNINIPPGAVVLHSDDKWTSVRFPANPTSQ